MFKLRRTLRQGTPDRTEPNNTPSPITAIRREAITDAVFALMTREDEGRFADFIAFVETLTPDERVFYSRLISSMTGVADAVSEALRKHAKGGAGGVA